MTWKQHKLQYVYVMEYHIAVKNSKLLLYAEWVNLICTVQSKRSRHYSIYISCLCSREGREQAEQIYGDRGQDRIDFHKRWRGVLIGRGHKGTFCGAKLWILLTFWKVIWKCNQVKAARHNIDSLLTLVLGYKKILLGPCELGEMQGRATRWQGMFAIDRAEEQRAASFKGAKDSKCSL